MEAATQSAGVVRRSNSTGSSLSRYTTEAKQAFKTSEFWLTLGVIAGILVSAAVIKGGDSSGGTDEFIARHAWLYVAIVTGAYAIGRGLAKSGSHEPYGVVEPGQDVRDNAAR